MTDNEIACSSCGLTMEQSKHLAARAAQPSAPWEPDCRAIAEQIVKDAGHYDWGYVIGNVTLVVLAMKKCGQIPPAQPADAPALPALIEAAEAVIQRWDSPLWKDLPHTATYIDRLRAAIAAAKEGK